MRGSSNTTFFDVGIIDNSGIDDFPDKLKVTKLPDIGGHEAVRTEDKDEPGGCFVSLAVSNSSRVDTAVLAGTDTTKACQQVMELAKQVEPKLP